MLLWLPLTIWFVMVFQENPLFQCFVAEVDKRDIGMALYYYRYSTWKGKPFI